MKKILSLSLLTILLGSAHIGYGSNSNALIIPTLRGQVNELVEIPVIISSSVKNTSGFSLKIGYDPEKLKFLDVKPASRINVRNEPGYSWGFTRCVPGIIQASARSNQNDLVPEGTGQLCRMRFLVISPIDGPSPIWFEDQNQYDNILISDELKCLIPELKGRKVSSEKDSPIINATCSYTPGDVNGDNNVIGGDVTYLVNYFRGSGNPPPISCWNEQSSNWLYSAADANGDCQAICSDVTFLVNYFRGLQLSIRWCDQTPPQVNYDHYEIRGECLGELTIDEDSSYMEIEVIGNDLHIYHMNASYQCCLEYYVEYELNGYDIIASEYDIGELCDCICPFNLESVLVGLANGTYSIQLIGIYGNMIGEDTFTIGGR